MNEFSGIINDSDIDISDNDQINFDQEPNPKEDFQIDFVKFFKDSSEYTIYLFPIQDSLFLLIQKNKEWFEQVALLKWREYGTFGAFVSHNEVMYRKVSDKENVYQICSQFFKSFTLYEIQFYMIPLVKETYAFAKYGIRKGNWFVKVHENVNLRNNYFEFELESPKFTMRSYQSSAVSEWHNNSEFGTISLATAGGKTIIALQCIFDMKLTTLIAVPTETLVLQWREDIKKFLNLTDNEVGLFYGKKKEFKPITIGTYNSLMKYICFNEDEKKEIEDSDISEEQKILKIKKREKIEAHLRNYYSFLVLDESHHIPAPTFRNISLNSRALVRLSLSATTERFDGNESLLYFSAGKKIFELDYISLCEEGWVVPFFYEYISVALPFEFEEKYKKLGNNLEEKRRLTYFNNAKLSMVLKIARSHVNNGDQILIFVYYVDDAEAIYEALNDIGLNAEVMLSSENQKKISERKRNNVIQLFKEKKVNILISTTVLDEGFNVPEANVGIICAGSSSERQMIQRIGRIVRKSDNLNKIGYVYEITTEIKDYPTLDQYNHLMRNRMIEETSQFQKTGEILDSIYWIFDYEKINSYAYQKSKERSIIITDPLNTKTQK